MCNICGFVTDFILDSDACPFKYASTLKSLTSFRIDEMDSTSALVPGKIEISFPEKNLDNESSLLVPWVFDSAVKS